MVVNYTGRHLDITDEMKEYLEKRFKKFKFYYSQILKIDVVVVKEKNTFMTEVKVVANHDTYFAKEEKPTWIETFDKVTDDIEKEIKKKKDKIKDHHKA